MAFAIVPCERNLAAPQKPQLDVAFIPPITDPSIVPFADIDHIPFDTPDDPEPDELFALAAELADDDQLGPIEAISQALSLQDELMTFAALWDMHAASAGNTQVHDPFMLVIPQLARVE